MNALKRKVDSLESLVRYLVEKGTVFVPEPDEAGTLAFRSSTDGSGADLSRRTDTSARELFQPRTRYFLSYRTGPEPMIEDGESHSERRYIIGMRGCDARAVGIFDGIFSESEEYRRMREDTFIIGYLCATREEGCFCDALGRHPHDTGGMDAALYPLEDGGFVLMPVSEKGRELLTESPFEVMSDAPEPVLEGPKPELNIPENLPEKLLELGEDARVWKDIAFPCVSCRVCTYVCPTCHCFTVTDEVMGQRGARATVWDSCQSRGFTREASGHNPREEDAARARQRIMHKFSYFPRKEDGAYMCTGCGRCIALCPTGRNLQEDITILISEVE